MQTIIILAQICLKLSSWKYRCG